MQFGIFDHCENSGGPAQQTYQDRFALAKRAEAAGFFAYHLAEHHGTPLSLVPSPNLFLAALAQHTTRLRLSALVYLLPLYDPYRLAEEIAMLDGLSQGRVEIGVGRGANPIELSFFGLDPASAKERFDEAFAILMQALETSKISHEGPHYSIAGAPIDVKPVQKPYPPIWYPSAGGGASLAWAASQGFSTIVNGPLEKCREGIEVFRENYRPGAVDRPAKAGLTRYVYVADTEEEAYVAGQKAFHYHLDNLTRLSRDRGITARSPIIPPDSLKEAVAQGWAAVGNPRQVREQLAEIFATVGNDYFVFAPLMADLPLEWGLRTIDLFESEIMPVFALDPAALEGA